MVVSREEYENLQKQVDRIKEIVEDIPHSSQTQPPGRKGTPAPRSSQERVMPKKNKIPKVVGNSTICTECNKDYHSTSELGKHIDRFHKNIYHFNCETCNKGFSNRKGLNAHKSVHKDESERIACDVPSCTVTFGTNKAKEKHLKEQHQQGGRKGYKCSFCETVLKTDANRKAHEKGCINNKERVELKCPICPARGFYQLKRLNQHKKDYHGWK